MRFLDILTEESKVVHVNKNEAGTNTAFLKAVGKVPADDGTYLYHFTLWSKISNISSNGLYPGMRSNFEESDKRNIYFSPDIKEALYWGSTIFWREYDRVKGNSQVVSVSAPILLRVKKLDIDSESGTRVKELIVKSRIPPEKIEVYVDGWKPVRNLR